MGKAVTQKQIYQANFFKLTSKQVCPGVLFRIVEGYKLRKRRFFFHKIHEVAFIEMKVSESKIFISFQ